MAEINTRLHYKLNGVTDEIKCYTTLTEVQNQGIPVKVGGVVGYAKYGPASDTNASRGNYKPPGGTAQRILKAAQVPYGEQAYTTPGTYTFTVPARITRVKVACVGGGNTNSTNNYGPYWRQVSSFGDKIIANTSAGGLSSDAAITRGYILAFSGERTTVNFTGYGHGGRGKAGMKCCSPAGFQCKTIDVIPGESYSCRVGEAFKNTNPQKPSGYIDPGDGFVLMAWGGDIQ